MDYADYQADPVGFAKDIMHINVTDDIAEMLRSVRDNRITVVRSATGTGKSHGGGVAASWFFNAFGPECRVYTVANPYENQKILWGEISGMVSKNPDLFGKYRIKTNHIERGPNDFITSLTIPTTGVEEVKESKFSGKHRKHMLFIVDEGDTVPDFAYRGIEGCMSGGVVVRILIFFNPRYEAGAPFRHERDHTGHIIHISAFNHPNVITGENVIPGAVTRESTVQKINDWCRPLNKDEKPSVNTFELPAFLIGATTDKPSGDGFYPPLKAGHYFVNEQAFHYIVLGQYPPQPEQQLNSREWVNKARARWDLYVAKYGEIPPNIKPILGGDVAEFGKDYNICAARYGGFIPRLKKWNGIDVDRTADRFINEYRDADAYIAYIDATGLGAGIAPKMSRHKCNAVGVKVSNKPTKDCEYGEFAQLRDQLYWTFREWLRTDPGAMLPPDEKLIQQILTPTYSIKNGIIKIMPKNPTENKVCMRDLLKYSPDEMEGVVMTFSEGLGIDLGFFSKSDLS